MVTIAGESAGGGSVALHTVSSHSSGLFRAAIAMSGGVDHPWTQADGDYVRRAAKDILDIVGCSSDDANLACVRQKSTSDILNATSQLQVSKEREREIGSLHAIVNYICNLC